MFTRTGEDRDCGHTTSDGVRYTICVSSERSSKTWCSIPFGVPLWRSLPETGALHSHHHRLKPDMHQTKHDQQYIQDTVSDPDSLLYIYVIVSQLGWRIIYNKVSYMLWLNSEVKLAGPEFGPDASGSDLDHRHGVFRPMSDATLHAQFCSDRDEPLSAC